MKILFISLGCDKNLVDSEVMLKLLEKKGYQFTDDETEADIIIINTCCFIGDAKEESVNTILEMAEYRKSGSCKALIVTGCLAQRYQKEILDEIEVLATSVQAKLLRFIETGEFRRLGENTVRRAKCRIIAISNENIGKLYSERRIRPDFYMRIAGATIMVPPLRDHIDDIEDLVRIHEQRRGYSERIRDIESFKAYSWPGNVRELFNTVDRIHTLGMSQNNLRVDDLRMESCFVSP